MTDVPAGRTTVVSLMFPLPAAVHDAPADAVLHVQVMLFRFVVVPVTVAPVTLLGPTLKTTTVYCMGIPPAS